MRAPVAGGRGRQRIRIAGAMALLAAMCLGGGTPGVAQVQTEVPAVVPGATWMASH